MVSVGVTGPGRTSANSDPQRTTDSLNAAPSGPYWGQEMVRSRAIACCRPLKARSSSRGLTREVPRTLPRAPRTRAYASKLRGRNKWFVHEVPYAELPKNTHAGRRGTVDDETRTGAARAGLWGEVGDLAEVHFHDAGGPGEGSQESPADARRPLGGQLPRQPDDCTKAGTGRERHGGPSGRDGYVADQVSRHTTHL